MQNIVYITSAEVADILRSKKNEIFDLWVLRTKERVEPANATPRSSLIDHLPAFIDHLSNTLDSKHPASNPRKTEISELHGRLRAQIPNYTLSAMLKEYRILREVTFEVIERGGRQHLDTSVRDYLAGAIEKAMEEAAEAFSNDRNKKIREEKETAEEAVRHQERFVAGLSHDLRNPIGTAIMGLKILEEDLNPGDEYREVFEVINRSLKRAEEMLKDLLDVARLSSGFEFVLQPGPCDLNELVLEAISDHEATQGKRFILEQKATVMGHWDKSALRRVIDNLLSNALKYGDIEAPITLEISKNQSSAFLSVHNQGQTIAKASQAQLFAPFTRVEGQEGAQHEGWGLGLSVVKAIAKAHGGDVNVESEATAGTRFQIILPLIESLPRISKRPLKIEPESHDENG